MKRISLLLILALGFYLGTHNGSVVLWRTGSPHPFCILPCRTALLPMSDQQKLEQGIPIASNEALARILEDYLS